MTAIVTYSNIVIAVWLTMTIYMNIKLKKNWLINYKLYFYKFTSYITILQY